MRLATFISTCLTGVASVNALSKYEARDGDDKVLVYEEATAFGMLRMYDDTVPQTPSNPFTAPPENCEHRMKCRGKWSAEPHVCRALHGMLTTAPFSDSIVREGPRMMCLEDDDPEHSCCIVWDRKIPNDQKPKWKEFAEPLKKVMQECDDSDRDGEDGVGREKGVAGKYYGATIGDECRTVCVQDREIHCH